MFVLDYFLGSFAKQIIRSKWIPAFAGMTIRNRFRNKKRKLQLVLGSMPTQAFHLGSFAKQIIRSKWIPAFAGMTIRNRFRNKKKKATARFGVYAYIVFPFGIICAVINPSFSAKTLVSY